MKKRTLIILTVVIVLLAASLASAYFYLHHTQQQSELSAYERAMESNESAVLQNFLDNYADAPKEHRDSVKAHLEVLKLVDQEWVNAVRSQSKSFLQQFMKKHPESIHITEARLLIDSLDWVLAADVNTEESYKQYMEQHHDGMHYDDASYSLNRLAEEARLKASMQAADSLNNAAQQESQESPADHEQPAAHEL